MLAVSKKFAPTSMDASITLRDAASSERPPKLFVPSPKSGTVNPLVPSRRCSKATSPDEVRRYDTGRLGAQQRRRLQER